MRRSITLFRAAALVLLLLFVGAVYYLFAHRPEPLPSNQTLGNGYGAPAHLADLENQAINESSGVAASRRNPEIFWTHNDSGGEPFVYAFDRQGKDRGTWRVGGATALDWEDMAVGPGPTRGQSYIYVGDIGDNGKKREEIIVYRVAEPSVAPGSPPTPRGVVATERADVIRLKYPDGKHDAESLLIHPATGDLYIVTKVMAASAGVYKLKAPFPDSGVATLTRVGEVRFPNQAMGFITGGDISPDGLRVILCDYMGACEFALGEKQGGGFDEIWKQPAVPVNLGARRQGEAICYRADGAALLATSERLPCPLIEVTRGDKR